MAGSTVVAPTLGLYLNTTALTVPKGGLQDGYNFRVRDGKIYNKDLGWLTFALGISLNGVITMIDTVEVESVGEKLIFGTPTDLYRYDSALTPKVRFLTPIYVTGQAATNGTAVTGSGGTLWSANVKNGDEIYFGSNSQTDPSVTWYTITNVGGNTALTISSSAGVHAAQNYTIRQKFTGDELTHWDAVTFLDAEPSGTNQWIATNGIQYPVSWDGSAAQVTVQSALAFTAKCLAIYSNMLIYGNLVQGGEPLISDIINSDVGSPFNVSSGLSEQFKIHADVEEIADMVPLGDNLAIYSNRNCILAQFVGDPLIFAFRKAISGMGPVAERVVADYGYFHEFLGHDGMYRFDGSSAVETSSQVWSVKSRERSAARSGLSYHFFDETFGELVWAVAFNSDRSENSPDVAFVTHYVEPMPQNVPQPISLRHFPFTAVGSFRNVSSTGEDWDTDSGLWDDDGAAWDEAFDFAEAPTFIAGDEDGNVWYLNAADDATGRDHNSFVRFGRNPLGDLRMRGLLRRVYPFAYSPTGDITDLNVRSRFYDYASAQDAAIDVTFDYDISNTSDHFVSVFRRGRFFDLEFGTDGQDDTYVLEGYDFDATIGGRR